MTTHFYTGPSAPDVAQAATIVAQHYAAVGEKTLLFSLGPAHYLPFALQPGLAPQPHAPNLDVLAFDALAAVGAAWEQGRARLPGQLRHLAADELPLLPASNALFGFQRLSALRSQYAQIVVVAGPHERLIEALALIDSLRWGVRLLVGLNQGPGASAASVASALLPVNLLPFDISSGAQELRQRAENARAVLLDPQQSHAVFVLPALAAALAEARLAVPALHLHGLRVAALAVEPLPLSVEQPEMLDQVRAIWPNQPVLTFDAAAALGSQFSSIAPRNEPPIRFVYYDQPAVVINLPGLPGGALKLTISGDELVLRIGPYRRHLLLPEGLRGVTAIKATREGETLVVGRR